MEKLDSTSLDITQANIDKLKELFPNVVTEGKVNFDLLKVILGDEIDNTKEKYQFTWPGKNEAIKISQTPSSTTLRPDKKSSKNWDTTENLYIEGDNLEVLKQLQKTYYGKIKMIYIDPPYNTGKDFVYKDNFRKSIENYKEQTNQGMTSNPETNGRYHSDWLNMMYPRLLLAKNLLTKNGVIFISIDDNEVNNLKVICDEIFGNNNFLCQFIRKGSGGRQDSKYFAITHEYILCYAKNIESFVSGREIVVSSENEFPYYDEHLAKKYKTQLLRKWGDNSKRSDRPNLYYAIKDPDGNDHYPMISSDEEGRWRWGKETMMNAIQNNLIEFKMNKDGWVAYEKIYESSEGKTKLFSSIIEDVSVSTGSPLIKELFGFKVFDYPKPVDLLVRLMDLANCQKNDIILDFFSGSATTAHAVMKYNNVRTSCKFIMVQFPEKCNPKSEAYDNGFKSICEIGEKRIYLGGEQIKKEWLEKNQAEGLFAEVKEFPYDIGFKVFKLDSTNIKPWDNEVQLDSQSLFDLSNVFKEGRNNEDVLYEIMLKYGVFDMQASEIEVNGKTMYRVGKRYMIVCLEDNITSQDIEAIGDLSPRTVIFKETGFNNDNDKINAVYNLEKAGVEDVKCI